VVLVARTADGEPEILEALGLTVYQVFAGAGLASLATRPAIAATPSSGSRITRSPRPSREE